MTRSFNWDVQRIHCYLFPFELEYFIIVPSVTNQLLLTCLLDGNSIEIVMKILIVVLSTKNVNLVIG